MTDLTYENYHEVLTYDYVEEDKQPKTFLEIAQQPHYENVISNILAFFFDTGEEHGLKDLFISCLINLLNNKGASFQMHTCTAQREYGVKKKGRIDILLKDKLEESILIIENKIYHSLNNDLNAYYDSVKKEFPEADILGIVLGLEPLNTGHHKFISITHREFIQELQNRIGFYYLNAPDKYLLLVKDYIQNINLNYPSHKMQDKLRFYHQYHQKINDLSKLHKDVLHHVNEEIEKAAQRYEYKFSNEPYEEVYYNYWEVLDRKDPLNDEFFYTLIFKEKDHTPPSIYIALSFNDTESSYFQKVLKKLPNLKASYRYLNFEVTPPEEDDYTYFASQNYELTEDNLLNLADFLFEITQRDFEPLKEELLTILTQAK
ncbi:PD-(D/E)XK nuclease family protein [Catalinimonas alkaloidigena]|uniref:PD-(D/E)XK nuclease family protein n=1 Tax=Catalinimonas alkaloidigena TaxID=1075417 RepID=UPI0024055DED|nr:PD-(D/E)XK nuclease family protein [Catalinimonas alkaloidigena]